MFARNSRFLFFCLFVVLLLSGRQLSYAEEQAESSDGEGSSSSSALWWPFEHIFQPLLNGLIFPIAAPVDYAVKNGIAEKSVELISFGEDYKIMVYPSFNFKPGSRSMVGANYRHRSLFFNRDYFVFQGEYFANGDMGFTARYTKHSLLGTRFFGGVRYDIDFDRDNRFTIPETQKSYLQPDSTMSFSWRLGSPITNTANWNAELWAELIFSRANPPDVQDSV